MKWFFGLVITIYGVLLFTQCSKSEYHRQLKQELSTGLRYDTVIFDIYFGMPRKDFFTYCWNKNREGLFTNGSSNTTVRYKSPDFLSKAAYVDFYPTFYEDRILEIPVYFAYEAFTPWDKSFSADSLFYDVQKFIEKKYATQFNQLKLPNQDNQIMVSLKGNRRILLRNENDKVVALFSDMSKEPDRILNAKKDD